MIKKLAVSACQLLTALTKELELLLSVLFAHHLLLPGRLVHSHIHLKQNIRHLFLVRAFKEQNFYNFQIFNKDLLFYWNFIYWTSNLLHFEFYLYIIQVHSILNLLPANSGSSTCALTWGGNALFSEHVMNVHQNYCDRHFTFSTCYVCSEFQSKDKPLSVARKYSATRSWFASILFVVVLQPDCAPPYT